MGGPGTNLEPASIADAVRAWYSGLPLITKSLFTLMVALYLAGLATGYDDVYPFCLSAAAIAEFFQVYRVFTAVLLHGGLLHICFNMLAFVPIGASLERLIGSVQFGYLIFAITVFEAVLYMGLAGTLHVMLHWPHVMSACAIGFSGVIFGLIVLDNAKSGAPSRSIFGLFSVPKHLYPVVLLLLWQLMMPNVSFLAHLSGALVGQLWAWGVFKPVELSRGTVAALEASGCCAWLAPLPGFVGQPAASLSPSLSLPVTLSLGQAGAQAAQGSEFGPSVGSFAQVFGWTRQAADGAEGRDSRVFHGTSHTLGGGAGRTAAAAALAPEARAAAVGSGERQSLAPKGGEGAAGVVPTASKKSALGRPPSMGGGAARERDSSDLL